MKTNILKLGIGIISISIALSAEAQSSPKKKTCINIVEIVNGKTINIDTCFNGLSDDEVQKKLSAMGLNDIQIAQNIEDSAKVIIDKVVSITDSVAKKIVIINNNKNGNTGGGKLKVISGSVGKVMVVEDDGYSYTTTSGNNGSAQTEVIVNLEKSSSDSNRNLMKVIVFHTISVDGLSDSDKLKIRNGVTAETVPFSNLKMYPNPVESTLMLSFSSSNTEPLQITIYDENGKMVYTEKVNATGGQVNKSIALNGYAPGIYFVNLLQGNQQETKKIVIGK